MDLVYFCLIAHGITQILVYGSIFDTIRPCGGWLGKLFHCPMCMGFWVGLFLWTINGFTTLFNYDYNFVTGFLLGCLASGVSYILNVIFDDNGVQLHHSGNIVKLRRRIK